MPYWHLFVGILMNEPPISAIGVVRSACADDLMGSCFFHMDGTFGARHAVTWSTRQIFVCHQETKLTDAAIPVFPAFANNCQRAFWYCLRLFLWGSQLLTMTSVFSTSQSWGELSVCELWSSSAPITLLFGYRRPSCPPASESLLEALLPITSLDFSIPFGDIPLRGVLNEVNGRFVGGTGHRSSSQIIDTVRSSCRLVAAEVKIGPLFLRYIEVYMAWWPITVVPLRYIEVEQVLVTSSSPNGMFRPHAPVVHQEEHFAAPASA